jgi:hypothetical protein
VALRASENSKRRCAADFQWGAKCQIVICWFSACLWTPLQQQWLWYPAFSEYS